MHFPWANVALLILLFIQVVTGYYGLTEGRESFRWILWGHGIGAYAIVVLLYWKSNIILDALRRKKRWTWQRMAYLILVALLLLTLVAGLAWTFYGPIYLFGFSLVSLHIYLAVPLMLLMLWHFRQMRFILRVQHALGKRLFAGAAVAATAGLISWYAFNWGKSRFALPGARRRFTGSYETGSFTGNFPVVSWINDRPPPLEVAEWQLVVGGAVIQPLSLTYEQLSRLPAVEWMVTIDCTGGWYSTQVWNGVEVGRLLEMAEIKPTAKSVTFTSVTGYQRRFGLAEAAGYLLALAVAGRPLSHGHGAPARLVAPEQRGVEWVKWLTRIEVNESSKFWQLPLPLQ